MNRSSALVCAFAFLLAGVTAVLLSGCEADPATENLTIQPGSAVLSAGASQEFTVTGGYDYKWTLKNDGVGSLSAVTGNRTVYTAPTSISTGATQTIIVDSTIEGTSGSTSNNTAYHVLGQATITFK